MARVKALREFGYGGRIIAPGDTAEVSDRDARLLIAVKRAEACVEPEPDAAPAKDDRRYSRRDMRAKD